MEIFLNLWDELDDLAGACRHIATSFAVEAAALSRPMAALSSPWPPCRWLVFELEKSDVVPIIAPFRQEKLKKRKAA
jgi:hypothetical protein